MKEIKKILIHAIVILISITQSEAATQMPYFGPDQQNCMINQPSDHYKEIDSGFVSSEDCKFIYILPPSEGEIIFSDIDISKGTMDDCDFFEEKIAEIISTFPKTDDPDYERKLFRKTEILNNFKKSFLKSQEPYPGKTAGKAEFHWNELIKAYKDANPNSTSQFVSMPIIQGMLSMKDADREEENNNRPVKIHVDGIDLPKKQKKVETISTKEYEFMSLDSASFIMGQKVGITAELDFLKSCDVRKTLKNKTPVAATYTYIFPVQTKGLVRIKPDLTALKLQISAYLKNKKNVISKEELLEIFTKNNTFEIEINNGLYSTQDDLSVIEDFRKELMAKTTEIVLGTLANQQAISLKKAEKVISVPHSNRVAIRGIFGIKIGEMEITWTTNETVIDWEKFEKDLLENLNLPSAQASNYTHLNFFSTSAMIGVKK